MIAVLELFAGIGGFSRGLEATNGFRTVAFCEIVEFRRKILAQHWPGIPIYPDVREISHDRLAADGIPRINCITAGFPCTDISVAGRQEGIDGPLSGLWGNVPRLCREIRPDFILLENVANLIAGPSGQPGQWFGRVLSDLAAIGFDAVWNCVPASAIGAPHYRDRIWIVAYPSRGERRPGSALEPEATRRRPSDGDCPPDLADAVSRRSSFGERFQSQFAEELAAATPHHQWNPEPELGRLVHGLPDRVQRIEALGDSVVPQFVELIGRAILAAEPPQLETRR